MSNLIVNNSYVPSMTDKEIEISTQAEKEISKLPQVQLTTQHTLHGGIYTRTIMLKAGEALVSCLINKPTTLTFYGHLKVYIGSMVKEVKGFDVIPAGAKRKQIMYALVDSMISMSLCTEAKTIQEAEEEFTNEVDKLVSRRDDAINIINITGE